MDGPGGPWRDLVGVGDAALRARGLIGGAESGVLGARWLLRDAGEVRWSSPAATHYRERLLTASDGLILLEVRLRAAEDAVLRHLAAAERAADHLALGGLG